jgi:hypothetical protein
MISQDKQLRCSCAQAIEFGTQMKQALLDMATVQTNIANRRAIFEKQAIALMKNHYKKVIQILREELETNTAEILAVKELG